MRLRPVLTRGLLVFVVLGVSFSLYHGFGSGMASYLLRKGQNQLAEGDHESAREQLSRAHELDPDHPTPTLLLAYCHRENAPERSIGLLEQLVAAEFTPLAVLDLLARLREETGDGEASLEGYRTLLQHYPGSVAGPLGIRRQTGDTALLDALLPQSTSSTKRWRGVALLHLEDDYGMRGYGTAAAADSLRNAKQVGVQAVSLRVPGFQPTIADPTVRFGNTPPGGETDAAVTRMIRDCHALGLRVLLKPHIMLERITDDEWRGKIAYEDPKDLEQWWQQYREFILEYARLAAREDVASFCIGVELRAMVNQAPDRWRDLIREVRRVYSGKLTYAANWYHEYQEVPFWSELDFIGVQFFFPLSDTPAPSAEELAQGLAPILVNLEDVSFMFGKPVLLTEVGFKSVDGATHEPWQWPSEDTQANPQLQARAYTAILDAFEGRHWCAGMFWWNWLSDPDPPEKFDRAFTPQGKPAEEVMRERWANPEHK